MAGLKELPLRSEGPYSSVHRYNEPPQSEGVETTPG